MSLNRLACVHPLCTAVRPREAQRQHDKLDCCRTHIISGATGFYANALQVLPEVTEDRWQYRGTAEKRGHTADVWELTLEPNEGYGTYHSNYTLYVKKASFSLDPSSLTLSSSRDFLRQRPFICIRAARP